MATTALTVQTRYAVAAIRVLSLLAPVIAPLVGPDRYLRFGERVARSLIRWRIDDGKWRRL